MCQVKLHLENHPKFGSIPTNELEKLLWIELAEAGVLFGPGLSIFQYIFVLFDSGRSGQMFASEYDEKADGHFRISFSNAEVSSWFLSNVTLTESLQFEDLKKAISIFALVVVKFFQN